MTVRLSDCTIQPPLSKWHALTLLHYLDLADGAPLTGRTITFSQYKDGLVRGGGLDRNAELIVGATSASCRRRNWSGGADYSARSSCRPTRISARGSISRRAIPYG